MIVCPYCGAGATLHMSSSFIYHGRDFGPVWHCPCEPSWVGCHKGTTEALGRLANAELRKAKQEAHAAFDPLWKKGGMRRKDAYRFLADRLSLPAGECHIGMFDVSLCLQAVDVCKEAWVQND